MSLHNLSGKFPKKARKRVGRGNASGHGTYSTRGGKGQTARTGGSIQPGYAGGQTPFLRQLPKLRGFKNPCRIEYQIVNIQDLNKFDADTEITIEALHAKKLIAKKDKPVKLLGEGKLEKALTITVHKASKSAVEAVKAAKGTLNLIEKPSRKTEKKAE